MAKTITDLGKEYGGLTRYVDWVFLFADLIKAFPVKPDGDIPVEKFGQLYSYCRVLAQCVINPALCCIDGNNRTGGILYFLRNLVPEKDETKMKATVPNVFFDYPEESEDNFPEEMSQLCREFRCEMIISKEPDEEYFVRNQEILAAMSRKMQDAANTADRVDMCGMIANVLSQYTSQSSKLHNKHLPGETWSGETYDDSRKKLILTEPYQVRELVIRNLCDQSSVQFLSDFRNRVKDKVYWDEHGELNVNEVVNKIQKEVGNEKSGYPFNKYNWQGLGDFKGVALIAHIASSFVYDQESLDLFRALLKSRAPGYTIKPRHSWVFPEHFREFQPTVSFWVDVVL